MESLVNVRGYLEKWRLLPSRLGDLAVPHLCISCDAVAPWDSNPALCVACSDVGWKVPRCKRCGRKCHVIELAKPRCHHCKNTALPFSSMHSLGPYGGWLRTAILRCKYNNDPLAIRYLSNLASRQLNLPNTGEELVVSYVPSHPKRLRERGARRQHLLTILQPMADQRGLKIMQLLKKVSYKAPQVQLSGEARRNAVEGTLAYIGGDPPPAKVVLFDDVWTTGSTLREACRILKEAGVGEIQIHVLAFTAFVGENTPPAGANDSTFD